jgi:hypothetical protein
MRMVVAGIFVLGVGVMYTVSMVDRGLHYTQVKAQVTSAAVDCYVESGRSNIVKKGTKQLAYMDCQMAPFAAKEFGFSASAVKKRAKLKFTYKSPADGSTQSGEHEVSDADVNYKSGQSIDIYGHTSTAKKYRWN